MYDYEVMYGYRREEDLLLSLRLMKYLHQQDPAALKKILELEDSFDEDTIPIIAEYAVWEICQDSVGSYEVMHVEYDFDGETYCDEYEVEAAEFTHPAIIRFGRLSSKWNSLKGYPIGAWQGKFSLAVNYFLGGCESFCNLECLTRGASGRIKVWLSPDCYDPLEFGNALVDLLLWLQKENERLERALKEAEYGKEAA